MRMPVVKTTGLKYIRSKYKYIMRRFEFLLWTEFIGIFITFGSFFCDLADIIKGFAVITFIIIFILLVKLRDFQHTSSIIMEGKEFLNSSLWEFIKGFVYLNALIWGFLGIWYSLRLVFGSNPFTLGFYLSIFIIPPLVWVNIHPTDKLMTSTRRSVLYLFLLLALLYINKNQIINLIGHGDFKQVIEGDFKFLNIVVLLAGAGDRLCKNVADTYVEWWENREKYLN